MSKQFASIHDAFFKKVMSDPQVAGQFLRERLPPEVAVLLSSEAPELLPGSYVSEELAQAHSDLLFRFRLNEAGSEDVFAYLLVEHKSKADPLARLQLLRYVTRILEKWYGEHKRLPLPIVLPLLAHHGPKGWTISTQFADLFGRVPEPLRPYLVSFRHALVDLARIEDDALSRHVRLRAFLKALKYIQRWDLAKRIDSLMADAAELKSVDVVLLLNYIGKGPVPVSNDVIRAALHRWVPSREEEIMASFGQEYFESGKAAGVAEGLQQGMQQGIQRGMQQGMQEGLQQGLQRGRASSLIELLETRFGRVPARLRKRIYGADAAAIDVWLKRVISAPDLSSIFGRGRGG